ncbi:MAG: peptidoglycan binding domain-containing protein, partial [Lachnospiraceae bacterium]|nr:peptidoglycan binding domain-containing protein [Lachnospiraceae bacterium]
MNKATYLFGALAIALVAAVTMPGTAQAAERTIEQGIYAGEIDLSGKTSQEAAILVQDYVDQLSSTEITLNAVNGNAVTVTASDLGLQWGNPQIIEEAIEIGKQGNIVQRYKALKSLEASAQIYPIELSFQQEMIETLLTEQCTVYDQPAVNAMLARSDGTFTVEEGQIGYAVDVTASATQLMDYLSTSWDKQPASIDLVITETAPQGDAATLS